VPDSTLFALHATAVQVKTFDDWYEFTVREIEEKAGILPPGEDEDEIEMGSEHGGPAVEKAEKRKVQRSAAPPPGALPAVSCSGAERVELGAEKRADLATSGELQMALQTDSSRYAVGLVFMEDKTLGFPRIFVRDVVPGGSADQSSRLKRGDLLVLIENEDIYGRDLDYVAAILPGSHGSFVRLGFANVDRSFIEIDLQRTTPISSRVFPSG
jgi:hypothetical protein